MKVSEIFLKMIPYKPGKPISETQREYGLEKVYKLASNENPLGPSPKAQKAVLAALKNQHRYPDPSAYAVLQKLSQRWGFPASQMALGNGSDEIIDFLCRIYCEPGEGVLSSQAAFAAYSVSAAANRAKLHTVPLTKDFRFDLKALANYFLEHGKSEKIHLIFIANPNNPTGSYVNKAEMELFFEKVGNREDVLIVFDEAYNEFVRATDYVSAQNYISQVKNLIVLRTFSKIYGLAGFRVGAMIAPQETVEIYNRVRKPFNVNDLAQEALLASLDDDEFIKASQQITWKGLDYFYEKLEKLSLPYIPSQGNFVMFDTERDVKLVNEALLRRGIIARPLLNYGFQTELRLSVGLEEENVAAMKALEEVLREVPRVK